METDLSLCRQAELSSPQNVSKKEHIHTRSELQLGDNCVVAYRLDFSRLGRKVREEKRLAHIPVVLQAKRSNPHKTPGEP